MSVRHRIVVVGRGGREHALAWRLSQDPETESVWVAPGNPGIARRHELLPFDEQDVPALVDACQRVGATLVVIGPEAALAAGVVDALAGAGVAVFGPTREAARLETSKWFAKTVLTEAGVPTARAACFTDMESARRALGAFGPPWVVKADGIAAGKGVQVTESREDAVEFLAACLSGERFRAAGRTVVLEEFLAGEEVSVMAVCDGQHHLLLPPARDHKRAHDGDRGANTGGMGALAPAPRVDATLEREIGERVVAPVLAVMRARGVPFHGTLYAGLILTEAGPKVLEFNARFGDPEAEVVLPLLAGSFTRLLASAAAGRLEPEAVARVPGAAVAVALVDEGYPERPPAGGRIEGLDRLEDRSDVRVFCAGVEPDGDAWRVSGGRAAYVVATADSVAGARESAYAAIATLSGSGWRCRSDIGHALARAAPSGAAS